MTTALPATPCRRRRLGPGALALAGLLALALPAQAAPAKYEIDPEHFHIGFLVNHAGVADVLGMFLEGKGSFTFDEEAGTVSDIRVVIDTKSVFTNHKKRDNHLRSPDFLNAAEFPEMVFAGARSEATGERTGKIEGTLNLLGVEKPVTLDITLTYSGKHPVGGAYVTGISARGSFQRSAFGMTYGVDNGLVGDEVKLILSFEALRQ